MQPRPQNQSLPTAWSWRRSSSDTDAQARKTAPNLDSTNRALPSPKRLASDSSRSIVASKNAHLETPPCQERIISTTKTEPPILPRVFAMLVAPSLTQKHGIGEKSPRLGQHFQTSWLPCSRTLTCRIATCAQAALLRRYGREAYTGRRILASRLACFIGRVHCFVGTRSGRACRVREALPRAPSRSENHYSSGL